MSFKDFIFNTLPDYFHRADTNKDLNNEGTLQRFLQVLGIELDDEVQPALEELINELDRTTANGEFLNYISDTLGNPPDIFLNEPQYRKLLQFVISIYKIKGTKLSYSLFFNILGFDINIVEYPDALDYYYDDPSVFYDDGITFHDNGCKTCSDYDILFTNIADPFTPPNQTTLSKLRTIIPFVEPINAKLQNLLFGISLSDDVNFCLEQDVRFETFNSILYDNPTFSYDAAGANYDDRITQNTLTLPFDCAGSTPLEGISIWGIEDDFIVQ